MEDKEHELLAKLFFVHAGRATMTSKSQRLLPTKLDDGVHNAQTEGYRLAQVKNDIRLPTPREVLRVSNSLVLFFMCRT